MRVHVRIMAILRWCFRSVGIYPFLRGARRHWHPAFADRFFFTAYSGFSLQRSWGFGTL
jgi:hypothetical protein